MTSPSKLELSHTTELYTGDIVQLVGYDKKSKGLDFTVFKTTSPCSCESGVMITVEWCGKLKYTLDRHWFKLMVKASEIDFNDDIPF